METKIILLGHGSRRKEANASLIDVANKVSKLLGTEVTPAFMGHDTPSLPQAVNRKIMEGAKKILVMPLFLFRGMHVSVDIHEELLGIREVHPDVEITFTRELGADDAIAELAVLRIKEEMGQ